MTAWSRCKSLGTASQRMPMFQHRSAHIQHPLCLSAAAYTPHPLQETSALHIRTAAHTTPGTLYIVASRTNVQSQPHNTACRNQIH
eukprot:2551569-Rhodomonas_salina.2